MVVRTDGEPTALVPVIREMLAEADPELPMAAPSTVSALMDRQPAGTRFVLSLVRLFSASAS